MTVKVPLQLALMSNAGWLGRLVFTFPELWFSCWLAIEGGHYERDIINIITQMSVSTLHSDAATGWDGDLG